MATKAATLLKAPKTIDTREKKNRKLTRKDVKAAAAKYKNWGRWGKDDEIGTLNFTTADHIVAAAKLVQKGKVMSLALKYDQTGPQGAKSKYPALGRFNPIHLMTRTGTDAYAGILDHRKIRGTDDIIIMPLQCGTQWDGLGHIMYENYMWNGYDCRNVSSSGAAKAGIEKTAEKMVGRLLSKVDATDEQKKKLEDAMAKVKDALKGDSVDAMKKAEEELTEVWHAISSEIYAKAREKSSTAGGEAQANEPKSPADEKKAGKQGDVVDADFEVVDDKKK